jgi:hypothetical protein
MSAPATVGDGAGSSLFLEDASSLLKEVPLYVSEANRSLPLIDTETNEDTKGINLRRYEVHGLVLRSASGAQSAQKYEEASAWFDRRHAEWLRLDSDVRIRVSRSC